MADAFLENQVLPWSLARDMATLQVEQFRAQLQLTQPEQGLDQLLAGHEHLPGRIMQVRFAQCSSPQGSSPQLDQRGVTESYVRGQDLVADYPPAEDFPFRSVVYWRVLPRENPPAIAAIETIVSTQTDLLDSHPRVSVQTALPAIELWRLTNLEKAEFRQVPITRSESQQIHYSQGPGCYLWRLSGERWSFAEMLPPSDFHSTDVVRDAEGLVSLSHRLFARSLEKGVILRARVRGILLERGRDAVCALEWYRDLLQSELPLTT